MRCRWPRVLSLCALECNFLMHLSHMMRSKMRATTKWRWVDKSRPNWLYVGLYVCMRRNIVPLIYSITTAAGRFTVNSASKCESVEHIILVYAHISYMYVGTLKLCLYCIFAWTQHYVGENLLLCAMCADFTLSRRNETVNVGTRTSSSEEKFRSSCDKKVV